MYKFLGIMAGFLLACLPAAAQTQQPIRINCGGPANTDTNGQVWQADTGYNTGTAFTINTTTAGTTDPTLYLSYRYNDTATTLIYSLPVANGSYTTVTTGTMAIEFDKVLGNSMGVPRRR